MTTIIRRVKNKQGYFALCAYKGTRLTPLLIHNDYDFIVNFCKSENYTWYFNLDESKAIEIK